MKGLPWLFVLLFALLTVAGATNVSYVDMPFTSNGGGGENLFYSFRIRNGVSFVANLDGIADACYSNDVCAAGAFFSPGEYLVPQVTIGDFEDPGGLVIFNGHTYDTSRGDLIQLLGVFQYSFVGSDFYFPVGGHTTFIKTVDAQFSGPVAGRACTASSSWQDCADFAFSVPTAEMTLSFSYNRDFNVYFFQQGRYSNVPEPASAGLMATGLVGIVGIILRRRIYYRHGRHLRM